jgi:hypothetical protein
MNDSMVDRLDDREPVTITEALEIPQPRAVGSPLARGNGSRVLVPPTYADLEDRVPVSHPGPRLAPSASNLAYVGPMLTPQPAMAPAPEDIPVREDIAPDLVAPAASPTAIPVAQAPAAAQDRPSMATPPTPRNPPVERPVGMQMRPGGPSTLQRAAGVLRHAIPFAQKLLPLLDGNIAGALSGILSPSAAPAASAPPPRVDLTPINQNIAELQGLHKELSVQIVEQNNSLKRVEDRLELVREATDRNTLEQQELHEKLRSTGSKVNVVATIAIGLLLISLLMNVLLYLHVQRVLP